MARTDTVAAKPKSASKSQLEKDIKFEFYAPLAKSVRRVTDAGSRHSV